MAVTEPSRPCTRFSVKRPLLTEASFSRAVVRESTLPRTIMGKTLFSGIAVEISFAVMSATAEGRTERF